MVEDQGGGRRLYKARDADGGVTWVDHQELWRLQQDQAEAVRRRQARGRGRLLLGGVVAVAVAVVLVAIVLRLDGAPPTAGPGAPSAGARAGVGPAERSAGAMAEAPSAATGPGVEAVVTGAAGEPALPATATAAPPPPPPAPGEGAATAVLRWADAWAGRNVEVYLASYSAAFQPSDGLSLAAWRTLRRERLMTPSSIEVEIEGLEVIPLGQGRAEARFLQRYRSPLYADVVRKTLQLTEERGEWRIVTERAEEP